jgi:hypothetical protein
VEAIYAEHAAAMAPFIAQAACQAGCAFCCTHFGRVDVTTLEGMRIWRWLQQTPQPQQRRWWHAIQRNSHQRLAGRAPVCPFLAPDKRCRIYALRPFSCRQLYSLRTCGDAGTGPVVHRAASRLAQETVARLQRLDATGYSGHISDVLCLLADHGFRNLYRAGGFDPAAIAAFGKRHGLILNSRAMPSRPEAP